MAGGPLRRVARVLLPVAARHAHALLAREALADAASQARHERDDQGGPSVAPASANTEPAELKCRVSRTKPQDTNITPIVAIRNASGTALPMRPATAVPLSAIAARAKTYR